MIQGFYSAGTALRNRQKGIDVIANNIANVNTKGFKKSDANFEDALYQAFIKEYPDSVNSHYTVGNGSYISSIDRDFSQGRIEVTENQLDIAISGEGFIGLVDEDSNILYSRGGSFSFTPASRGKKYIVNEQGYYLADSYGRKISVPDETDNIMINEDGRLEYDGQSRSSRLMLMEFSNPKGLIAKGAGTYAETEYSGAPIKNYDIIVKQGHLEMSNVDLADEMTELIKSQRIYQMNSKVIQTIDEMQAMSNKLRR